ncbi:MAG: hypothetical protein MZV70_17670 [Desulfobacterales bacterium]|nr:hypothetical protein [Desulfobacterales bacterium]
MTALKAYQSRRRQATRQIVQKLEAEDFKKKVEPHRIQNVLDEGAVIPEAMEVIRYWGCAPSRACS